MASSIPQGEKFQSRAPETYPLVEALLQRRSRRFARGAQLPGGPLAYASQRPPQPLTLEEEALLAFAACGITGYTLADLPYQGEKEQAGGNILIHLIGRTVASGDAAHAVSLFVINDQGAWMLKRPQDFPPADIPALVSAARRHAWTELYAASRVQIADHRVEIPREIPFTPTFNRWSANLPGSSYFLPVSELTALYINIMLTAFDEENGYYVMDERNNFQAAGVGKFTRSKGGHLYDDFKYQRYGTIGLSESWLCEFTSWEHGAMLQNLALMGEALGLGGFSHFAAYPAVWPQALGFRMQPVPFSRVFGLPGLLAAALRLLGRDVPMPTALGLEHNGQVLIKPYCPPYYRSMEEAVLAYVDYKFGPTGTLRDPATGAWRENQAVKACIPRPSDRTIAATIAYCDYVYRRFGRFPAVSGPFRTLLAHQAHHLDPNFYQAFYSG